MPGENKTYDSETLKSKRGNKILCVMKGQGGTREAQNICYRAEDVIEKPNSTEYDDWVTAYNPEEKNNPDLQDYKLPVSQIFRPYQQNRQSFLPANLN